MAALRVVDMFHALPSQALRAAHASGLIDHVRPPRANMTSPELYAWLRAQLPGAHAAIIWRPHFIKSFDSELLDIAGPNFKVVANYGVGYEHIDLRECKRRGVRVGYTPYYSNDAVADHTLSLLLMVTRRIGEHSEVVRQGNWPTYQYSIGSDPCHLGGQTVRGRTIGFLGFGRIAQKVVERLLPMGPERILFTASQPRAFDQVAFPRLHKLISNIYENVQIVNEPKILSLVGQSDILICLSPLVPSTFHVISDEAFSKMKKHAILVNVARGPVVDTSALVKALKNDQILAAALDVLEGEPHIPADHPLLDEALRHKVLLLPHCASAEIKARMEMGELTARNVLCALGLPPDGHVESSAPLSERAETYYVTV